MGGEAGTAAGAGAGAAPPIGVLPDATQQQLGGAGGGTRAHAPGPQAQQQLQRPLQQAAATRRLYGDVNDPAIVAAELALLAAVRGRERP